MKFCEIIKSNPQMFKKAFIAAEALKQAGAMPPPPPGGAPMDPAMMGGAMPPPPPPPPPGGAPMDPAMMGEAPQPQEQSSVSPEEIMTMIEDMADGMEQYEQELNNLKAEMQNIKIKFAEAMTTVNNVLDILNKGSIQAPKAPNL